MKSPPMPTPGTTDCGNTRRGCESGSSSGTAVVANTEVVAAVDPFVLTPGDAIMVVTAAVVVAVVSVFGIDDVVGAGGASVSFIFDALDVGTTAGGTTVVVVMVEERDGGGLLRNFTQLFAKAAMP